MTPNGQPILQVANLSLAYGRQVVLRDVNFEVHRGQRWFIVGPNGHGKTTLLRGILGLLPAHSGKLQRHPEAMAHEHIGFVPQRCDLSPSLPTTVREFIALGLVGQTVPRRQRIDRIAHALDQVHMSELIDADYHALSGGQRQRTLLARALIRRPHVLLLDEPTSGLDLTAQQALLRILMERNQDDALTILFVTHDVALAARHATHAALIYGGGVTAGPVREVLRSDRLRQAYGAGAEFPTMPALVASPYIHPPREAGEASGGQGRP